jgi:glucose-6-phosphate 1-dehydrogenase
LGKETVQNILFFRLANSLLDPNLDADLVESIEIKYLESNGIGSRGAYFDKYGQLRDMLQSHMLQLFATTFMDIPDDLNPTKIAKSKVDMINSLKISNVLRAQYTEGVIQGKKVNNYLSEINVAENSMTETFVKLEGTINNHIWKGTSVIFITGKALSKKLTEVVINYKKLHKFKNITSANKLIFRIQPEEGITLVVKVKKPGQEDLEDVSMSFKFNESFPGLLGDAYEAILLDILRDKNLFSITTDELEASWNFVEPILSTWEMDKSDMKTYPAGSDELLV